MVLFGVPVCARRVPVGTGLRMCRHNRLRPLTTHAMVVMLDREGS